MFQILELQDGSFLIKVQIDGFTFSGVFQRLGDIPETFDCKEGGLKIQTNQEKQ